MTITEKVIREVRGLSQADTLRVLKFIEELKNETGGPSKPPALPEDLEEFDLLQFFWVLKDSPSFHGDLVQWQRDLRTDRR